MPILALKDNPPSRFPEKSITDTIPCWWIAKVFPRQEKALAFDLLELEIEYYLPLYTKVTYRKDNGKAQKSVKPLFPSYVPFVCEENAYILLKNRRVSTILSVRNQRRFVNELNRIYLANKYKVSLEPLLDVNIKIGRKVKIISGPMSGTVCRIAETRGKKSLLLSVNEIGNAMINVDVNQVRYI